MNRKTYFFRAVLSVLLAVLCMVQPTFAAEVTSNNNFILSDNEILNAVSPLIKAEEAFYDVYDVSVEIIEELEKTDGSYDVRCEIVFDMCLKADSVEELPYVAGMLNEIGVSTAEAVYAMSDDLVTTSRAATVTQQNLIAAQVANEIKEIESNIANDITLAFSILINAEEDGTINATLGCGEPNSDGEFTTFPLSDYFPANADEMYSNGASTVSEVAMQLNSNAVMPCVVIATNYDRIAARDYAMTYSSNASYSEVCPHGKHYINLSYYNDDYEYYCHTDCANFVSQAIYAGGIPTDSTWQAGEVAWINVPAMHRYFFTTKHYWGLSTYEKCNAGGIIINSDSDGMYHINMCVLNDTVNHAYAAHNNDRRNMAFTSNYWSDPTTFYTFLVKTF